MKETIVHKGELFDRIEEVEVPDPDTSLHIMGGPPTETPRWVLESWKRAAEEREKTKSSQSE